MSPKLGKTPCPCYHRSKTPSLGPLLRDTPDIEPTLVLSLRSCWEILADWWDNQVIFFQLDLFYVNHLFLQIVAAELAYLVRSQTKIRKILTTMVVPVAGPCVRSGHCSGYKRQYQSQRLLPCETCACSNTLGFQIHRLDQSKNNSDPAEEQGRSHLASVGHIREDSFPFVFYSSP